MCNYACNTTHPHMHVKGHARAVAATQSSIWIICTVMPRFNMSHTAVHTPAIGCMYCCVQYITILFYTAHSSLQNNKPAMHASLVIQLYVLHVIHSVLSLQGQLVCLHALKTCTQHTSHVKVHAVRCSLAHMRIMMLQSAIVCLIVRVCCLASPNSQ